jgi:hypothetical protein
MVSKGHSEDRVTYSVEKFFSLAADCEPGSTGTNFITAAKILNKATRPAQIQPITEPTRVFIQKRGKELAQYTVVGTQYEAISELPTGHVIIEHV